MKNYRTPHWKIAFKAATIVWLISLVVGFPWILVCWSVFGGVLGIAYFTFWIYFGVYAFMYGVALLVNVVAFFVDRDPTSKRLRQQGFDPYWDNLPVGFLGINTDSQAVRMGGRPEPEAQANYNIPADWTWQCSVCGARNPREEGGSCWNCHSELTQHADWEWRCNTCGVRNPSPQGNCYKCGNSLSNEPPPPPPPEQPFTPSPRPRFTLPLRPQNHG